MKINMNIGVNTATRMLKNTLNTVDVVNVALPTLITTVHG